MLGDIGAFNFTAISCAFALTLALLPIVRNASLKLFCRPCLDAGAWTPPFVQPKFPSFRGCHLSEGATPLLFAVKFGLGEREELSP